MPEPRYTTFREFWPFYLEQHRQPWNRRLHFAGTLIALGIAAYGFRRHEYFWLWGALVAGYLPAWIGHFFIEKNRPATFKYPLYSFMGDMRMLWQTLTSPGRINEELDRRK